MKPICRFALHDYNGDPRSYYLVHRKEILPETTTVAPEVTHHIFLVDRSGSMYYDMAAMRSMLEKVLTLAEYKDSSMLATLISYSSKGDYTVHFSRKSIAEIMAPGSGEVESIRQLRVTGLTCMSQALEATTEYIEPGETTGISLHSDGYANDRSPAAERRQIDRVCEDLAKIPSVFVNTIAYSSYSDFKLLAHIANAMNGKCVQAGNVKEVFDALNDTSSLLSGRMAPAIEISLEGADYFTFVSHSAGRVNGSSYDTVLLGLKPEDDKTVYWFTEVSETGYLDSDVPVARDGELLEPLYAFTMAKIAEGQLNTAKFALIATRDAGLIPTHYRALTAPALAAFYADMQTVLFKPTKRPQLPQYGLGLHKVPLTGLITFLDKHKEDLTIDLNALASGYQRQGIQRTEGSRTEQGGIEVSRIGSRIHPDWEEGAAKVGGFDLNNNTASVNVLTVRPIQIYRRDDSAGETGPITEVGGVKLDELCSFRNYTLVSDGALNVPSIRLRIASKRVYRGLDRLKVIWEGPEAFDPTAWYTVRLDDLPLVDFATSFESLDLANVFVELARCKSLISLLTALLKGKSDRYTPEQIEALKEHDITSSLYYSPKTTNPYIDKTEAMNSGLIDSRVSFKIDIGSTAVQILSRSQLHSGNQMLARFYSVMVDGKIEKKPNWTMWWEHPSITHKQLSSRTKITPIDDLMRPLYDGFLGLGSNVDLDHVLSDVGMDEDEVRSFFEAAAGNQDPEDAVEIFTDTLEDLQRHSERLFDQCVRPLVFYIGATGLLPDQLDTPALTAEQVGQRYPLLKIGKNEKEGTYFVLDDGTLLSVNARSVTFSVDRQVETAQAAK